MIWKSTESSIGEPLLATIQTGVHDKTVISLEPFGQAVIRRIREVDDKLFELDKEYMESFIKKLPASEFKKTCMAAMGIFSGFSSIKLSIFELCKAKDLYSSKILFRSLLDHFLKLNFFFHRLAIDKNDSIGEEFTEFFPLAELVSYGKSLEHVKKILQLEQSGKTFYEILCELKPEYKTRSKKEVERKISQLAISLLRDGNLGALSSSHN